MLKGKSSIETFPPCGLRCSQFWVTPSLWWLAKDELQQQFFMTCFIWEVLSFLNSKWRKCLPFLLFAFLTINITVPRVHAGDWALLLSWLSFLPLWHRPSQGALRYKLCSWVTQNSASTELACYANRALFSLTSICSRYSHLYQLNTQPAFSLHDALYCTAAFTLFGDVTHYTLYNLCMIQSHLHCIKLHLIGTHSCIHSRGNAKEHQQNRLLFEQPTGRSTHLDHREYPSKIVRKALIII